jgi:hypothetical protein
MEWFTLVSTAVGAILGVGATTLNDRLKWRRERTKALYDSRSKLYSDYLADLTKTRDSLRLVARSIKAHDMSRRADADDAFASANIYARRYQIRITASDIVANSATAALRALRDIRDVIGDGHEHHSDQYNQAKGRYDSALTILINAMQEDLEKIR